MIRTLIVSYISKDFWLLKTISKLIDISIRKNKPKKAYVYLDGADSRLFKMLIEKLGSEKRAQDAIILEGIISKSKGSVSRTEIQRIKKLYTEVVGFSYSELQNIVSSIS